MTVLDTDILSDFLHGRADVVAKVLTVPTAKLSTTIVTAEEALKGWLKFVANATGNKTDSALVKGYAQLHQAMFAVTKLVILPYTPTAHTIFLAWRVAKVRIGTQDLRIAAICVAHDATLVSRNKRDFDKVPELKLSVWN